MFVLVSAFGVSLPFSLPCAPIRVRRSIRVRLRVRVRARARMRICVRMLIIVRVCIRRRLRTRSRQRFRELKRLRTCLSDSYACTNPCSYTLALSLPLYMFGFDVVLTVCVVLCCVFSFVSVCRARCPFMFRCRFCFSLSPMQLKSCY